jgi:eukaryotic-like serine/threonine-protein kinase
VLEPGQVIERYRVELTLGEGGAATVYRVRHTTLGTLHALKLLHIVHPTMRSRLIDEGRIQARLRHPNIVAVTDVLDVDGAPALLMEFVGGGSLADRLQAGPVRLDDALRLFRGVVAGVAHAHAEGLVHRDLKPANVLLAPGPDPTSPSVAKVTDFGIARILDGTGPGHTWTGVGMGTPAYMAPEQAGDARGIDARADIFSLGVMLYELVTGERPFQGSGPLEPILAAQAGRYRPPEDREPTLPPPVCAAIHGSLRADRQRRIESCEALIAVLDGAAAPPSAAPPTAPTPAPVRGAPAPSTQTIDEFLPFTLAPPTQSGAEAEPGQPATIPDSDGRDADAQGGDVGDPEPGAAPLDRAPARPRAAAAPRPPPTPAPEDASPLPSPAVLSAPGLTLAPPDTTDVHSRTATALVVDETGQGHAVEVVVALSAGDGGVWAPPGVERDAQVAAQLAVAVALGAEARRWSVRWRVRGPIADLHGTSIGLAIAVATRAARLERPVPAGWAFTGGIDLDQRVATVAGLPAKVRAAAAAGCRRVALPATDRAGLKAPSGVRLVPVSDFGEFSARLLAERSSGLAAARRWWPLTLLLLPLLAAFTELSSPL